MISYRTKVSVLLILMGFGTAVAFQNCSSKTFSSGLETEVSKGLSAEVIDPEVMDPQNCSFNGQVVLNGEPVQAFLESDVLQGQCQSENRVCRDGVLSGQFQFATCTVHQAPIQNRSCLFNGRQVAHGQTVKAFLASSAAFGSQCSSEDRICNNGLLSGSYIFGTCAVGQPADCQFNGTQIKHGQTVQAFVYSDRDCTAQPRRCENGRLNGQGNFATCSVAAPKACLFNGQTLPHGASVDAYMRAQVPVGQACVPENRRCTNGSLSGTAAYTTCTVEQCPGGKQLVGGRCQCAANMVEVMGQCTPYESSVGCQRPGFLNLIRASAKTDQGIVVVTWAYCHFLGRLPERAGFEFWVNEVNKNGSFDLRLMGLFAASAAKWETCQSRNNAAGPFAPNSCFDSSRVAVSGIYSTFMGRAADDGGLNFWAAEFDRAQGAGFIGQIQAVTLGTGGNGLIFSNEFRSQYSDVFR